MQNLKQHRKKRKGETERFVSVNWLIRCSLNFYQFFRFIYFRRYHFCDLREIVFRTVMCIYSYLLKNQHCIIVYTLDSVNMSESKNEKKNMRMEMTNVSKRKQPNQIADNSTRPLIGPQLSKETVHPEVSFRWPIN